MVQEDFITLVQENLPYNTTESQKKVLGSFFDFLLSDNSLFLLKGYAGTGKSSLIGGVIKTIVKAGRKPILLAPTGRAAKVFESYADYPAFTIHRKIYRQKKFSGEGGVFDPAPNLLSRTLFFVDEASMISNVEGENQLFGTGRLLDDLIHHVYNGQGCKLIIIGDTAQLPPIGQSLSPAMQPSYLEGYSLDVFEENLTEVIRQKEESGILYNATILRKKIEQYLSSNGSISLPPIPKLKLKNFTDIVPITHRELPELLESAYSRKGREEVLLITRSNLLATRYNQQIRNRVLYREEELSPGDNIVISKNNYLWLSYYADEESLKEKSPFIANGETAVIERIRKESTVAGLRFVEVQLYLSEQELSIEALVHLDTLYNGLASLAREKSESLTRELLDSYTDLTNQREKYKRLRNDPYYNALHIKFAYSVTGHKAQGGQWSEIFIDLSNLNPERLGIDFYRWLYTAITRATERVYLINPPDEMF